MKCPRGGGTAKRPCGGGAAKRSGGVWWWVSDSDLTRQLAYLTCSPTTIGGFAVTLATMTMPSM